MADALTLEAPPTMFDEVEAILGARHYQFSQVIRDRKVRGVRRMDTASYTITQGSTSVDLWVERRVGNPSMFIMVIPKRKLLWRRDRASDRLADQIIEWLVEHGASPE